MNVKLSEEQRQAIQNAAPAALPVVDDESQSVDYLLDEQSYLHLAGLRADHERNCETKLRELIEERTQSGEVPADEAFARLRSFTEQLQRSAS